MTKRAFTLIEVMVAMVVAIIVMSIVLSIYVQVVQGHGRARNGTELAREGAFAARVLARDLRQAGLGVPTGQHIQRSCSATRCTPLYGTIAPASFPSSVIVANPVQVGVVGDVVRPNAQFNTFGNLSSFRSGSVDNLAWHTENNGACMPRLVGTSCRTGETSFFFPKEDGCDDAADVADRTCPWALGRVQPGDRIQIVAGNGHWSHAAATAPLRVKTVATAGELVALALDPGFDGSDPDDVVWHNDTRPGAGPGGIVGGGFVTTLDRVFWFYDAAGTRLLRVQCWGDPDPDHIGWPDPSATSMPALAALELTPSTSGASVAPNVCTPPEVMARFVDAFQLRYFDEDGVALGATLSSAAQKAAVRRIDFRMTLRKPGDGVVPEVVHELSGSVRLANLGGT